MNQEKPIKNVQLKFACAQDWHKMTPCGGGRFCGVCQKIVYDFTNKSQADLDKAIQQHNGNICGRFQQKQANQPSNGQKKAKKAALLAASLAAAACQPFELQYPIQPEKETHQSVDNTHFMGKFAPPPPPEIDSTPYFLGVIAEQTAEFIGGQKALFDFLKENIRYPKVENRDSITTTTTVYVGFTVDMDGSLTNIAVKRGKYPAFNAEAIRVVQLMNGKWKARKLNGKFVKTDFTMPIQFHAK
jgi:TonB family protein